MQDYLLFIGNDVHAFWSDVISSEGGIRIPPDVAYYFPLPGERTPTPVCGPVTHTDDETALFCPLGNRIFISQALAVKYWDGTYKRNNDTMQNSYSAGDYSTALLVAHEYGHNLQENYHHEFPKTLRAQELHADCLAGVWGKSLFNAGRLENGDSNEAIRTFHDIGDYSQLPTVHRGTPAQRYSAYSTGYNAGTIGACFPYFNGYAD